MPTAVAKNDYDHYEAGLELAKKYGIKKLHIGEGICHTIMHEAKYAKPGEIATATDSHTTTSRRCRKLLLRYWYSGNGGSTDHRRTLV